MSEKLQSSPRKVLIVEDSGNWQSLLPRLFEDEGVEAIVVDSAES